MEKRVSADFQAIYGSKPQIKAFGPGRINLIGEHVDYNGGIVLPAAVDLGITFAISTAGDNFEFYSCDLQERVVISPEEIKPRKQNSWVNYFLGVIEEMTKRGHDVRPVKLAFGGNIPIGSGMSSSAALECGFGVAINEINDLGFDRKELAHIGQMAEHNFAGVKCGIMDQFASLFGKESSFIELDCLNLEHKYHPFISGEYQLLLIDTHVKHSLADSAYNERRDECEEGLRVLNRVYQKEHPELRHFSKEEIIDAKDALQDSTYNRILYVAEEIKRVGEASEMLDHGDIVGIGQLLYESHYGLKKKYEVSCSELDFLVDFAQSRKEIFGARMMGGGFGGCTINILNKENDGSWKEELNTLYFSAFNKEISVYEFEISNGATTTT